MNIETLLVFIAGLVGFVTGYLLRCSEVNQELRALKAIGESQDALLALLRAQLDRMETP